MIRDQGSWGFFSFFPPLRVFTLMSANRSVSQSREITRKEQNHPVVYAAGTHRNSGLSKMVMD